VAVGVVAILAFIAADLIFRFREQNRLAQEMAARQTGAQAAILAEQNRAALEQAARQKDREATDAQARGDFEGARRKADEAAALRRQEGTPGAQAPPAGAPITSDLEKFASENWPWLLLAGGGVVFLVSRF
jgi:type II secretory pathway pseudopilin PulG